MDQSACDHRWSVSNLRKGYLTIEGCFQCKGRIALFSEEPAPPIDDHRDGEHFWAHLGNFQASRFDLKCAKCSREILLSDVMALMLCMSCDPDCGVFEVAMREMDLNTRVCVALCADTTHASRKCIGQEELRALNEYLDGALAGVGKKIVVVPCLWRTSVDNCQGVALADVGPAGLSEIPVASFGE